MEREGNHRGQERHEKLITTRRLPLNNIEQGFSESCHILRVVRSHNGRLHTDLEQVLESGFAMHDLIPGSAQRYTNGCFDVSGIDANLFLGGRPSTRARKRAVELTRKGQSRGIELFFNWVYY